MTDEVNERPYTCDQCGKRAYVEVYLGSILNCFLFCAHHYKAHEERFEREAFMIIDNRDQLA